MQWEATDQFGNLFVATSNSTTPETLQPELESMVEELTQRTSDPIVITVDFDYAEINGPNPEEVSHIIQVPWLSQSDRPATLADIKAIVDSITSKTESNPITVN
jgi:hypothetical protein